MRAVVLFLILATQPGAALAGAWPRDAGEGFASLQYLAADGEMPPFISGYLDVGLGGNFGFGLEGGGGRGSEKFGRAVLSYHFGVESLRVSVSAAHGWRWDLGTGEGEEARAGLHLGADLPRAGWAAADLTAAYRAASGATITKLDITGGWRDGAGRGWVLQLQGRSDGVQESAALVPSVLLPLGAHANLELGAKAGVWNDMRRSLLIGTWLEF